MTLTFNIKHSPSLLFVSALLLFSSTTAFANTCDRPSTLKQELGEDYFLVDLAINSTKETARASTLPDAQHTQKIQSLLEKFNTTQYATASGSRHLCKGGMSQRRLVNFDSELRLAETNHSKNRNAAKRVNYLEEAYSAEDRMSFDQKIILELPAATQWRVVADNSIVSSQINRRRTETGFSVVTQIDTELKLTAQGIKISQTNYINGYSDNWATWTVKN